MECGSWVEYSGGDGETILIEIGRSVRSGVMVEGMEYTISGDYSEVGK